MSLKKSNFVAAALAAGLMGLGAVASVAQAGPQENMKAEEIAHPRLANAIRHMQDALAELKAAPDDFGGNKVAAIHDTEVAIHSLRKALYYRLKMDDAAIDRAH